MTELKPPRYITGPLMLLAGIRQHHAYADAQQSIPSQWQQFRQLAPIPGAAGTSTYGVICGNNLEQQTFEYMCAIEVPDFDAIPADLGRIRIHTQQYAVFTHEGHISSLQKTWNSIWNEWLPASGYQTANVPDFEVYDQRFDPQTGLGIIEIWCGITP